MHRGGHSVQGSRPRLNPVIELRVVEAFENDPIAGYTLEFDLSQDVSAGGAFNGAFIEAGNDAYRLNIPRQRNLQLQTGDGMGGCPGDTYMRVFKVDGMAAVDSLPTMMMVVRDCVPSWR